MNKIILVFMLVFGLFSSIALAEEKIDEQRWHWVNSSDTQSAYIDKNSIVYDPEEDCVDCWFMVRTPAEDRIRLEKIKIYFSDNQFSPIEFVEYKNSKLIRKGKFENTKQNIVPLSLCEQVKDALLTLINRDEQLKEYNDNKEKEEKKAKRDERNEEIKNMAIDVLGNIAGVL